MEGSLYLIFVVVFGGFFLMNLILAAIMDSFEKVDKEIQSKKSIYWKCKPCKKSQL